MDLLKSLCYPEEVAALINFKLGGCRAIQPRCSMKQMTPTEQRCYDYLNKTSRSFAAVIQALDGELRHAVCVFYLVLRALDTIEDDMTIPMSTKIPMLKEFHTYLYNADWKFLTSQEKDKIVLEDFMTISHEFRALNQLYQGVIADITKRMGGGMTVFFNKDLDTEDQWDEYCHYVAGLVGIGLSQLFSASGLEDPAVGENKHLANSMGLFLQKTNIIRDYLEDLNDGRVFWPKSVWSKYGSQLSSFKHEKNSESAINCLNNLVTNALSHVPDVIEYMSQLRNQSVFQFCAIPQVMAIATLERLYGNIEVFRGVVKIRKGEAMRLMSISGDVEKVKAIMRYYLEKIASRVSDADPSCQTTRSRLALGMECTKTDTRHSTTDVYIPLYMSVILMVAAIIWHYWNVVTNLASERNFNL